MGLSRRRFTREFKEAAVRRMEMGVPVAEVARAAEVSPNALYRWRREMREFGSRAYCAPGRGRAEEHQVAVLERKVGQQALEIDFFRGCLQHLEEQRKLQALTTRSSSIRRERSPRTSRIGGWPKKRLYSRLNCVALW
jgi:transposase